ncbi:MAG: hypothetical protein HKN90_01360 [Flavobacteriaceae bacterium]|nr:hypothetical protein [Flavobacteriaceae bacterium]
MKNLKSLVLLALVFLMVPVISAQEKKTQAFWIHEDHVMLSKTMDYEKVSKELVDNLKKHDIQDEKWLAASTSDNRYLFIGALNKMADLDRPLFGTLSSKMGKEGLGDLFNRMDKCYTKHVDYIIYLDNDLSYMPGGMTMTPEGQDYREFHYLHFKPGNAAAVKEQMKAVKKLFVDKDSKVHYRVYRSGFGASGDFYMVAIAAKDHLDMAQKGKTNDELLGEEGGKTFGALWSHLTKYKKYEGKMRPDLSYTPKKSM